MPDYMRFENFLHVTAQSHLICACVIGCMNHAIAGLVVSFCSHLEAYV